MAGAVVPIPYGRHKHVGREPIKIQAAGSSAGEQQTGIASGSAATVVITPPADRGVVLDRIDASYRVAPTAGTIQATDGTNTWGPFTIVLAGLQQFIFDLPLLFLKGAAVTVTLADGGQTKDLYVASHIDGPSPY